MSIFQKPVSANLRALNTQIEQVQSSIAKPVLTGETRKGMFALESASVAPEVMSVMVKSYDNLKASLSDMFGKDAATGARHSNVAIEAAAIAAMHASDWQQFTAHRPAQSASTDNVRVVNSFPRQDFVNNRLTPGLRTNEFAMEAYDERANRDAVSFNVAYQLGTATQGTFGETLYPTIVMDPTRDAYEVVAELMMVYDGAQHKANGSVTDFMKHNLIRAIVDPTILKKNQTRATPVYRAENAGEFVANSVSVGGGGLVPRVTLNNGEGDFASASLKTGKNVNVIGLAQTDAAIGTGGYDSTDSLDPYVTLEYIDLKFVNGADTSVVRVKTKYFPYANFLAGPQDNYRRQNLNMTTTSVLLSKNTLDVWGAAPAALADLISGEYLVRLEVNVNGYINIETGTANVSGSITGVAVFQDKDGNTLSQSAAPQNDLVAVLQAGTVIGWNPEAYLTNQNRRRIGQRTDTTRLTQMYRVPLRAPISAVHPAHTDGAVDASDIQQLIATVRTQVANEAVTSLYDYSDFLEGYMDVRDSVDLGPDLLGLGRLYVRPTYIRDTINMLQVVDSRTSTERMEDVRNAVLNLVRDYAYKMYVESEYGPASEMLNGGVLKRPTVVIATNPYFGQFLMDRGESRTLGPEFEYQVVTSFDNRLKDDLFITFCDMSGERNTVPLPLSCGNCLWASELALTANISRGNTLSRETMVQPRYLFVNHCPTLTRLTITNLSEVLRKVATNMHSV